MATKSENETVRINLDLPAWLRDRIRNRAISRLVSVNAHIRQVLGESERRFEEEEKEKPNVTHTHAHTRTGVDREGST